MSNRNFRELLESQWSCGNFVCVGLDSEFGKIAEGVFHRSHLRPDLDAILRLVPPVCRRVLAFNAAIIDATYDLVCAYKPNAAFYEALGDVGWLALRETVVHIKSVAPDVPIILDAKRADIGNTNEGYARMAFEYLDVDAITVHPYLGAKAMKPFLERRDKGIIVLCRTSNEGSGEFQNLPVETDWAPDGTMPLYQYVAMKVAKDWNSYGNCGLVVGAQYSEELRMVRQITGEMPILIPGVGFQQKDVPLETQVKQVVEAGKDSHGKGIIVNSSRGIIFSDDPRGETHKLRNLINRYRKEAA